MQTAVSTAAGERPRATRTHTGRPRATRTHTGRRLQQAAHATCSRGRDRLSTAALGQVGVYTQKTEAGPLRNARHKKCLKMDLRLKCKPRNYKTETKTQGASVTASHSRQELTGCDPEGTSNRRQKNKTSRTQGVCVGATGSPQNRRKSSQITHLTGD